VSHANIALRDDEYPGEIGALPFLLSPWHSSRLCLLIDKIHNWEKVFMNFSVFQSSHNMLWHIHQCG
jgi:hypothetical protein